MNVHASAALGPAGRLALVRAIEEGMTPATAHRWWHRFCASSNEQRRTGAWMIDRSSRPHRQPRRLSAAQEEAILLARRQTNLGPGRLAGICRPGAIDDLEGALAPWGLAALPRAEAADAPLTRFPLR